ncbi:pseudouridine synthase [Dendrothele bispora CBS 962.96]|uniref:Pseudouridine synthase n=1 Tax=Dendrothele bispora (strain CBS 962.96) TaxID=1314807 RepID=A0A4S8MTW3_DENBC|nr:pseudouridine synthase [Dendrothele bispora CBS 962.96]
MTSLGGTEGVQIPATHPGLKKIPPYWYPYTTYAKERWLGRELLEVVSTEFRDRSMEYYRYALESGVTTINGKVASPNQIIQNGDRMENVVHRHEPPVSATPVKILLEDKEREFLVVDKPGSIPVHASGRYYRNTLVAILMSDFGYEKVYTVNRLDRLTSGLMIVPTSSACARKLTHEFVSGTVRKEYVARCKGEFPEGEVVCEEPLLTVDRQMGLNIVHPKGKHAKTIFQRIRYDSNTDSSVVLCKPLTGRSHQIRVHLQYLGHPIANDTVYSEERIWGAKMGKGGIDTTPSDERSAPKPPEHLADSTSESLNRLNLVEASETPETELQPSKKLLPRETGEDIGMGSPVPLSSEAVEVITRLRNMKDEAEDWSRWRDVIFRAKGSLKAPRSLEVKKPPPNNRRRKNKGEFVDQSLNDAIKALNMSSPEATSSEVIDNLTSEVNTPLGVEAVPAASDPSAGAESNTVEAEKEPIQISTAEAIEIARSLYCSECYLPLHPDPKPEQLYIFLHALRYTTSLGCFETEMPEWSAEGWTWDRD